MKQVAPAADRNKEAIAKVLQPLLPRAGTILEVASGTGQHIVHFAAQARHLTWQPSDVTAAARDSIAVYIQESGLPNIMPPLALDATAASWPHLQVAGIININMLHIAPWAACDGLFRHAAALLPEVDAGQKRPFVLLYGPFFEPGVEAAASNVAFDASLRQRDPSWGLRSLPAVLEVAADHGLAFECTVAMPANNLVVVFRR